MGRAALITHREEGWRLCSPRPLGILLLMKNSMLGFIATLATLMVAGCGSDCVDAAGYYDIALTEISGDCGDIGITTLGVGARPASAPPAGCVRFQQPSSDACSVSIEMDCDGGSELVTHSIDLDVSADGMEVAGSYVYESTDASSGAVLCSSTYDFTGTLQP